METFILIATVINSFSANTPSKFIQKYLSLEQYYYSKSKWWETTHREREVGVWNHTSGRGGQSSMPCQRCSREGRGREARGWIGWVCRWSRCRGMWTTPCSCWDPLTAPPSRTSQPSASLPETDRLINKTDYQWRILTQNGSEQLITAQRTAWEREEEVSGDRSALFQMFTPSPAKAKIVSTQK